MRTLGQADIVSGTARNLTDPFRIASITKTFIGTGILQLVDDGKLKLEAPIATWFPDFPNAEQITIADLLEMRSGIPDYATDAFMANYYKNPLEPITTDDLIAASASRPQDFTPPAKVTSYRNINFVLLEQILTKVSGQSAQDFLASRVFAPLQMKSTFYATTPTLPGGLRGYSYDAETGLFIDRTELNPTPAGGAGAIVSTAADMTVYARALGKGTLLSKKTQDGRLRTYPMGNEPGFVRYGQGIVQFGDFVGHNGTIFGFSSESYYLPEQDATIVINVNRLDSDDSSGSTELFLLLATILFPDACPWAEDGRKALEKLGIAL